MVAQSTSSPRLGAGRPCGVHHRECRVGNHVHAVERERRDQPCGPPVSCHPAGRVPEPDGGRADRGRQEGEDHVQVVPTDLQEGDADVQAEDDRGHTDAHERGLDRQPS